MPKQALIMIDMQRGFLDSASPLCIPSAEATVPACAALIDRCHAAGIPVIYAVRHYRSDGSEKHGHDFRGTRYSLGNLFGIENHEVVIIAIG